MNTLKTVSLFILLLFSICAVKAWAIDPLPNTYGLPDTGQAKCYNDFVEITCPAEGETFYGQDTQFTGNNPSFTDNGDGTVTDNVTGLMWQQGFADTKLTYAEAQTYVETLNTQNYSGYSDWRLPTIKQLYSLIDFRGTDPPPDGTSTTGLVPFIDTDYFGFEYGDPSAGERIIDSQWVTTTLYTADNNMIFGVNFADGRIKGYDMISPDPQQGEKTFYVRLCRGNTDYGTNSFIDNDDGTVTDNATGLMWTQSDSGQGLNWEDALAWAEQKNAENYLGYNDWRLPNAKELQSIVDYTRSPDTTGSAAIDPIFSATQITNEAGEPDYPFYWSSTTHANWTTIPGGFGVYVAFGRAMGYMKGTWVDVHGAGAQRSDPKSGDPANWPTGHGPQGDAIRIYNYVRLVRDVDAYGYLIALGCPCSNPWKNHGAYVSCVAHASGDFVSLGLITEEEKDAIVSAAAKSTCGHKIK